MKPIVNRDLCVGCGACEGEDPEIFKVIDGKSEVQVQDAEGNMIDFETHQDSIGRAIGACPVAAISLEGAGEENLMPDVDADVTEAPVEEIVSEEDEQIEA